MPIADRVRAPRYANILVPVGVALQDYLYDGKVLRLAHRDEGIVRELVRGAKPSKVVYLVDGDVEEPYEELRDVDLR